MMWGPGGQPDRLTFAGTRDFSGGKGGKQETTTTQSGESETKLPDWLSNASQDAINQATALGNKAYTPYTGQIVAGTNADTQQAYQQIRDLQGSADPAYTAAGQAWQGLLGSAAPITAQGLNQNTNSLFGNYQQNVMNPAQGLLGSYASQGPATAQGVASGAQYLMNPYTANVINPALAAGEQARQLGRQTIAGNAQNVGAFGGSRQGVAEGASDAQFNLGTQQQIGNMLTQGWGQALSPATQVALQGGQQGLAASQYLAGLGQQGYNAAASAGQQMANTNLNAGMQAAQLYPQQAYQQAGLAQNQAAALQSIGTTQQQQEQAGINAAMGQFYEEQNQPYQNLDTLLAAVGAVPYGSSSFSSGTGKSTAQTTPGWLDTITGLVGSGAKIASLV